VGISADPVDLQLEFKLENALDYPLLSDRDGSIHKQFGTHRWGPLPGRRATFVIGADGTLLAKISSESSANAHADGALEALREHAA
jgi:peroxiredoxin Q/BCP